MRRILAFYIDHMFLSIIIVGSAFSLLNFGGSGIPISFFPVTILAGVVLWLGYFIAADYFFRGMTLGKKLLGLQIVWNPEDGGSLLGRAVVHTLLKWLLVIFWPIGLIVYFVSGCKMPYDLSLGILDLSGREGAAKTPVWKIIAGIAAAIVMCLAVLIGILIFTMQRISAVDYYTLGDEKIASVYTVLGRQKLVSYSSSKTLDSVDMRYQYSVDGDGEELAERYVEYLILNEGFHRLLEEEAVYSSNVFLLVKESMDGEYELSILLVPYSDHLEVVLHSEYSG